MILSKADQSDGKGEVKGNCLILEAYTGIPIELIEIETDIYKRIKSSTLKHSFDNGATWYTEDEIKFYIELGMETAKEIVDDEVARREALAVNTKDTKSCENCRYYNENGACKNESLDSMDKTLEFSDFWFSPTKDFCCNKHGPK